VKRLLGIVAAAAAACAGSPQRQAGVHAGPVTGLAIVSGWLYSCSQAGVLTGLPPAEPVAPVPFRATALAAGEFDGDVLLLVGGGDPARAGQIACRRANEGMRSARIADDLVYAVAIAPDGRSGAAACADGRVRVFALPELGGATVRHEHTAAARAVCFLVDGTLASAGLDGSVLLSSSASEGKPRALLDHSAGVDCLAASGDGTLLASGSRDGKVRLHRSGDGRLVRTYQRLGAAVTALAWDGVRRCFVAGLQDGSLWVLARDSDELRRAAVGAETVHVLLPVPQGWLVGGFARCWLQPRD
jgi:hypothetical protein